MKELWQTGLTRRWHTVPGLEQSVGEHSWGVAAIILQLNPSPSLALIKAALFHDCAEKYTGDVPATTKWLNPDLKDMLEDIERRWEKELGIITVLDPHEKLWLKAADMLELVLFCEHAEKLGNQYATEIKYRGLNYLIDMRPLPEEILPYVVSRAKT